MGGRLEKSDKVTRFNSMVVRCWWAVLVGGLLGDLGNSNISAVLLAKSPGIVNTKLGPAPNWETLQGPE